MEEVTFFQVRMKQWQLVWLYCIQLFWLVSIVWIIGQSELYILDALFLKHAAIFSIYFFAYLMMPLFLEAPVHFLSFQIGHILKFLIIEIQKHYFLQAWDYSHAHSSQFFLFLLFCVLPLYENFWKTLPLKTSRSFPYDVHFLMLSSWVPKPFKLVFWVLFQLYPTVTWHLKHLQNI